MFLGPPLRRFWIRYWRPHPHPHPHVSVRYAIKTRIAFFFSQLRFLHNECFVKMKLKLKSLVNDLSGIIINGCPRFWLLWSNWHDDVWRWKSPSLVRARCYGEVFCAPVKTFVLFFLAHLAMPKVSLYDHDLLLSLVLSGLLASVCVDSSPSVKITCYCSNISDHRNFIFGTYLH